MVYFFTLPAGVANSICSPFLRPMSAAPMGDSLEMRCSSELVSVVPTMVKVSRLPSSDSSSTVQPIEILALRLLEESTTLATERICLISLMRALFLACSSLAASYSAFSERSPKPRASWMR